MTSKNQGQILVTEDAFKHWGGASVPFGVSTVQVDEKQFETKVFFLLGSSEPRFTRTYGTEAAARQGHREVVKEVKEWGEMDDGSD